MRADERRTHQLFSVPNADLAVSTCKVQRYANKTIQVHIVKVLALWQQEQGHFDQHFDCVMKVRARAAYSSTPQCVCT